jgi:hypothetical protein
VTFKISDLDPGIRDLVLRLRDAGFQTTDSGDGASKFEGDAMGCAEEYPHVHMQTTPDSLLSEAHRLHELFGDQGSIQATYDPANKVAVLSFYPGDA